jgi:hypothetical protein
MSDDLKGRLVAERLGGLVADPLDRLPDLENVPLPPEKGQGRGKIDFEKIKRQLAANVEAIANRYIPNGKRIGIHWCTGDIHDKPSGQDGGSLKLDLVGEHAGKWHDFATGEKGDLLDLIQRREGLDAPAAIAHCERQGWLNAPRRTTSAKTSKTKGSEERRAEARRLWESSQPLDGTVGEAYLRARDLNPPHGPHLRFHLRGTSGHPSLVAAFVAPGSGDIAAVQTTALTADGSGKAEIDPPRRTIGSPEGAGVVVQANPTATEIIIVEGVETALSLRAAAPDAEIVAFGPKNNLANARIDTRFERVTIAADQDAKDDLEKLADRLRREGKQVHIAAPAPSDTDIARNYDFNDLLREKGQAAVKERLSLARSSAEASAPDLPNRPRGRFEARPFSEVLDGKSAKFLVKDLLPASGAFCLFGAPGAGKSFTMLDLAVAVTSGQEFAGQIAEQGLVVVLAGEGEFGLKRRLAAAAQERRCPDALEKIWSVQGPFDMAQDGEALKEVLLNIQACAGEPVRLVIVDTLSQTFGSGDQDKARDMQAWLHGVATMAAGFTDTLVGVVHHSGWAENRERGSTALRAALDLLIEQKKDGNRIILKPIKNLRDGEPWEPISLELVGTILPDGESTLTIKHLPGSVVSRPGPKPGSGHRKSEILAALAEKNMTLEELTDAMPGSSKQSNAKTLKTMISEQLIEKDGDLYRRKATN